MKKELLHLYIDIIVQPFYQVYVADIKVDAHECARRNIHERTLEDIQALAKDWEKTPESMNTIDLRQLLQDSSIQEVIALVSKLIGMGFRRVARFCADYFCDLV